jgi:hypothetical protein
MGEQIRGILVGAIRAGALQLILTVTARKHRYAQRPRALGDKDPLVLDISEGLLIDCQAASPPYALRTT